MTVEQGLGESVANRCIPRENDTLKRAEEQINILSAILEQGRQQLKFPALLERRYITQRNQRFLEIDRKILIGGLLFYLGFSWTDFYLGGDNAQMIFTCRLLLSLFLLSAIWWIPRSSLEHYMVPVAAAGIFMAGLSVIVFTCLIPGDVKYAYHLGLIPIQVFTMVAMRLSYRSALTVSVMLLVSYLVVVVVLGQPPENEELTQLTGIFIPMFILFWLLLIVMGGYMAFMMESAARSDFLQNRLLAVEAERLQYLTGRLHVLSTTDCLTGIANRRYFEEQLQAEWRRCQRSHQPLSLVMIDIDYFKDFNDSYGHQRGDDCLRRVAQTMAAFCQRPGDLCARYGGEEFVILLPATAQEEAQALVESLRRAVEQLAIPHRHGEGGVVTVSAGVAARIPGAHSSSDQLLSQADRRLYQAKEQGRNQVTG